MKTFVIIFRQGPRQLTESDKNRRAEETAEWARRQNGAGHKLDPHILAPENAHRGPESSSATQSAEWPITALLFLEAQDLNEAVQVAESHPALRYGPMSRCALGPRQPRPRRPRRHPRRLRSVDHNWCSPQIAERE
jgi:hypothetical protein